MVNKPSALVLAAALAMSAAVGAVPIAQGETAELTARDPAKHESKIPQSRIPLNSHRPPLGHGPVVHPNHRLPLGHGPVVNTNHRLPLGHGPAVNSPDRLNLGVPSSNSRAIFKRDLVESDYFETRDFFEPSSPSSIVARQGPRGRGGFRGGPRGGHRGGPPGGFRGPPGGFRGFGGRGRGRGGPPGGRGGFRGPMGPPQGAPPAAPPADAAPPAAEAREFSEESELAARQGPRHHMGGHHHGPPGGFRGPPGGFHGRHGPQGPPPAARDFDDDVEARDDEVNELVARQGPRHHMGPGGHHHGPPGGFRGPPGGFHGRHGPQGPPPAARDFDDDVEARDDEADELVARQGPRHHMGPGGHHHGPPGGFKGPPGGFHGRRPQGPPPTARDFEDDVEARDDEVDELVARQGPRHHMGPGGHHHGPPGGFRGPPGGFRGRHGPPQGPPPTARDFEDDVEARDDEVDELVARQGPRHHMGPGGHHHGPPGGFRGPPGGFHGRHGPQGPPPAKRELEARQGPHGHHQGMGHGHGRGRFGPRELEDELAAREELFDDLD